jgi:hypothetical protein
MPIRDKNGNLTFKTRKEENDYFRAMRVEGIRRGPFGRAAMVAEMKEYLGNLGGTMPKAETLKRWIKMLEARQ